jgi:hypothetical protein
MMRRGGLGTVFWSLVLIVIGVVLLLRNMGYEIPVWEGLSQYWPGLIIGWGLVKLVDYYRLSGEKRSLFSVGEVVLLVLVLMAGSAFTAAARIGSDLSFIGILGEELDLFDVLGESFEFTRTIQTGARPGGRIEIHNIYGSVEVSPGDADAIVAEVTLRVRATDREEAERLEPGMEFTIEQMDGNYVIDSNRDDLSDSRRRRFRSSLRVRVPRESQIEVDNRYGSVQITGLTGDQQVRNKFGSTTLRNIDGDVGSEDGYGTFVGENVSGDITVTNEFARVDIQTVGGNVSVDTKFGAVHLTDIEGDMTVENRFSEVTGYNVGGRVRIGGNNNSIDLEAVGAVGIETTYQDVVVQDPTGAVDIVNRHGDVRVSFSEPPRGDITLSGEYTDVWIDLPNASNFFLDARSRRGFIESDFEGLETIGSGPDQQLVGEVGSQGPNITIETRRGDVRLNRRR